jgi:EAL and modified HD-GYP domain-containing signal transduction protein
MKPALIRREPVLNSQKAITASRLIVHADSTAEAAEALNKLLDVWPKAHSVFVGLAGCLPDQDLLAWLPPENAMIEITAASLGTPAGNEFLAAAARASLPLCFDGYAPGMTPSPAAGFRFLLADAGAHLRLPRAPGIVLAKGLADMGAFAEAMDSGYAGASGWFFLHGRPPGNKLNPGHAQIIRVLNLVRQNAEVKEIEAALKQDVTLSYKLLRYINSAGFGLSCEIESFRHAVTILGYNKLNKWLSLLLVTASRDPAAAALLQAAIARGRIMELLGADLVDRAELDNLFITGAFSLLDVLLGALLDAVLEEMSLPETITDALLRHQGAYAPLLDLALACEGEQADGIAARAATLGIGVEKLNHAQIEAVTYADSMQFG